MSLKQWVQVDHLTHPKPVPEETPRVYTEQGLDTMVESPLDDLAQAVQDFKLSCPD